MPDQAAAAALLRAHVEALWTAGIRDGAAYERLAAAIIDGIYAVPDGETWLGTTSASPAA